MKQIILLTCLTIVVCSAKTDSRELRTTGKHNNNGIDIFYKGYFSPEGSYLNDLIFTIENNTAHTVYLSTDDIKIEVLKNDQILKEDIFPKSGNFLPPDYLLDITFFSDKVHPKTWEEKKRRSEITNSLKKRFAEKLYRENFGNSKMSKIFLFDFMDKCLIVLPKEKINFSTQFISKSLDYKCKVHAEYKKNDFFTVFEDENGKQTKIKY